MPAKIRFLMMLESVKAILMISSDDSHNDHLFRVTRNAQELIFIPYERVLA